MESQIKLHRVNFYQKGDLSNGYFFTKVKKIIDDFPIEIESISDIIELFEVKRYIDSNVYENIWTEDFQIKSEKVSKKIISVIYHYFSLNIDCIFKIFEQISDYRYKNVFWEIVENFNFYKTLNVENFKELSSTTQLEVLFRFPKIVKFFNDILKVRMLTEKNSAVLLIRNYAISHNSYTEDSLYFPKLSSKEINEIFKDYIESENPHPKYLEGITLINNIESKEIESQIKLAAKKKAIEINNNFINSPTVNTWTESTKILIGDFSKKKEVIIDKSNGLNFIYKYDKKSLFSQINPLSVIKNFILYFEFADIEQNGLNIINSEIFKTFEERYLLANFKTSFNPSFYFQRTLDTQMLQLNIYSYYLKKDYNLELENILKNYFIEYLPKEFKITGFTIVLPSPNSTYLEKCKSLCTLMESLIQQFVLYKKYGEIDCELLDFAKPISYDCIPSLLKNKYYYGQGNDYNTINHLLFSDQSMLCHVQRIIKKGTNYSNFFNLIGNEEIFKSDYTETDLDAIEFLEKKHFIYFTNNETIQCTLYSKIFNSLNQYNVINYLKFNTKGKNIIKELSDLGYLVNENSLLSNNEAATFNFLLNNKSFKDNHGLRNKYLHGSMDYYPNNEIHKNNYSLFLVLLISLIIKINDEIEINNTSEYKNQIL